MFLTLGLHPPANRFLTAAELSGEEARFPLDAHVCEDCALIQVPDHIPPGFFRHYLYVPSAAETGRRHFRSLAEHLCHELLPSRDALVVDIGCNDGLFLEACRALGARTLGIEPAVNLAEVARAKDIEVVNEYFSPDTARQARARWGPASVVATTNTLNHIDDLHGFVEGVEVLLGPRGILVIEVPHAVDLIEKNEFDTIYHEHLSEFTVRSLVELLRPFEMEVFDLDQLEIHGGSMRVYVRRRQGAGRAPGAVERWLEREVDAKLFSPATYHAFSERVRHNREVTLDLLRRLRREGRILAGYGAPAKGNTLLNYYGIGPDLLEYLVDRNELKHGLYSPGMHVPVLPVEALLRTQPDYVLLLAWNFADEILAQQEEYRRRGGTFIVPIPELRMLRPLNSVGGRTSSRGDDLQS